MTHILLTISGHDRAGIVCDVAEALLDLKANIADSSMTALRGRFTMMMIISLAADQHLSDLKAAMAELERRTGLHVQSQIIDEQDATRCAPDPDHIITVHGADQIGIVHAVSATLTQLNVSIVDLSTQARHSDHGDIYMMVLEVVAGDQAEAMRTQLQETAQRIDVDIELHQLDDAII